MIKLIEGIIGHVDTWMKSLYKPINKEDATLKLMTEIFDHYNYEEHGGSPFLGVKGIVLKSHGASSEISIKNSLLSAELFYKNNIIEKIQQDLIDNTDLFASLELSTTK